MTFNLNKSLIAILLLLFISAPTFAAWDPNAEEKALKTMATFKKKSPNMAAYFSQARGYIVFPSVGKAGFGIGGARGTGVVYEAGRVIGSSTLTQISFGFQIGAQVYSEIVFFKNKTAMNRFKKGKIELSAQASAIAVKTGISAKTDFKDGIAIFTLGKGGLMYEASVAGQKLSFKAK